MRVHALAVLFLVGCDDTLFPGGGGGSDTDVVTDDWCGVARVIAADCASCHSAAGKAGGLDLETDAHAAIVGVPAVTGAGLVLVTVGDPDASFFYRKLTGDLTATEGGPMPPGDALPTATTDAVRAWIVAGASAECADTDIVIEGYHPDGWGEPRNHGAALESHDTANGRAGVDAACRTCHGAALDGGDSGVSCDGCHEGATPDAWRTDCTFCHGGTQTDGGAPPQGILDRAADTLSFEAHTSHVTQPDSDTHVPFDCTQCHTKPSESQNVLAGGHIFEDTTDAKAEVVFAAGLSEAGVWTSGVGSCSNLYCHGNGRGNNGTVNHTAATPTCGTCHPAETSAEARFETMSGEHHKHVWDEATSCDTCHAATIAGAVVIDASKHVNKKADVLISGGGTVAWNGSACTGSCHDFAHYSEPWAE